MRKSQSTWGGLEPRRWPSSWCAYLWWSNNQPDEPSVSLGTPVFWKTGEKQMFSTTEQSQAVIHSTKPAHYFLLVWQLPGRNVQLLPLSRTVWLWQHWHRLSWGDSLWLFQPQGKDSSIKTPFALRGCSGMWGEGCGMLILGGREYWFRHPRIAKTSQLYLSSTWEIPGCGCLRDV